MAGAAPPASVVGRTDCEPHPGIRDREKVHAERRAQRGGIIRRVLITLFVLLTLVCLYLVRGPILRGAAHLLITEDDLEPADAIVVLGDDNYAGDRAARGAELFQARWAPVVVASGRYLRPYASVADLIARDLTDGGVPPDAIIPLRHRAASTREEALAVSELARERRWRRLIVVTSNYHTRRARYIFRDVLGADFDIRVAPAADSEFDPRAWWQSREGCKIFARETAAWLLAVWESLTGSDAEKNGTGALADPDFLPVVGRSRHDTQLVNTCLFASRLAACTGL
ncbi:MAG: YdcF family protein [Candidatus Acidiferrales bacterium]